MRESAPLFPAMGSVPTTIGRYAIQRVLGRGGMGTVYLAVDPLIEREVAIKVLPLAGADDYSERLIAEARVSGRLIHPHIVGVFDIGEEQGQPFVVMPYVDGRTVASILTDAGRPPMAAKLRWMAQLCDALAYAHERRVIHRDIKPTNLLIDAQGGLRVLDFGIAKVLTTSQIQFTSVGTPAYMAPEQYSSDPVDPRTDVFSAGLVFYELLTHRRALTGTTPAQIYGQLMGAPMPRVLAAAPETDPALAAVCERAMSRDPRDRFQTAREFGEAIEGARTGSMAITAPTIIGAPAPPLPEPEHVVVPDPVAVPPPVVLPPPALAALASTIRLERPNHDAILEEEALAAAPEVEPEPAPEPELDPVVEADERTALRPAALTVMVLVIIGLAILASLLWYLGSITSRVGGATHSGPRLHEHVRTPELHYRRPATWVRGPVTPECKAPMVGAPVLRGDPPVAVYAAASGCLPDGTADRGRTGVFVETTSSLRLLWSPKKKSDDLGLSVMYSLGGRRMLIVEDDTWHFVRVPDATTDATTAPKGAPVELSADGNTLLFGDGFGRLGLFDIDTVKTTRLPEISDGDRADVPAIFSGVSDNGRFVMYGPAVSDGAGGSGSGPTTLYRYDRNGGAMHLVDRDLGATSASPNVHFTAAVSDDGDWIAYRSRRRIPATVPASVPDPSLYLYAHHVSAGRTILVDSAPVPTSGTAGEFVPMAVIDANLLLYSRGLQGASTIDYLWQPLHSGASLDGPPSPRLIGCDRRALGDAAPPARMSPRCLRWTDGSSWCVG